MIILVMGVSGSGKTTLGKLLADSLSWQFSDADAFHSPENVEKMRRGIPLSEADRTPWLQDLQTAIKQWLQEDKNVVLACSALKDSYRQYLVLDSDRIKLIYLKGSYELIQKRLQERRNHYMPEKLLDSQFNTLEEPLDAICMDVAQPPQVIVQNIRSALGVDAAVSTAKHKDLSSQPE
jgi:gluconokinase